MQQRELTRYLTHFLRLADFDDYGPQGLQVEAERREVQRVALAVDVAPPIIEVAQEWGAGMLLVHHGLFWGSQERIAGPLGRRVRMLLKYDMHLFAAHLALDGHPEVGNNAVLAQMLNVEVEEWWCAPRGKPIGILGRAPADVTLDQFVLQVGEKLGITPRVMAHGSSAVQRVAIVSGFGADKIAAARDLGADTFLTGETSHANYWGAADHGINVIYAGHYASETVGVRALGRHLADKFGLDMRFFDFPTGM